MSSKLLSALAATAIAASPLAAQADSAPGEQKGDWIFRAGASVINPEGDNVKPFIDSPSSF